MTIKRNERTDKLLNDIYGDFRLMDVTFYPADILFELDPIAYRQLTLDCGHEDEEDEEDEE